MVRGWKRHSRHCIDYKRAADARPEDCLYDGIVLMSTRNIEQIKVPPPFERTVAGIHSENKLARVGLDRFAGVIAVSEPIYRMAIHEFPAANIIYVKNAVDGDTFKPNGVLGLAVGWIGDKRRRLKRHSLFMRLADTGIGPLATKCDWDPKYFVRERNRQDQVDFLYSCLCVVQCSETEGMSLATLEALACGVPVIGTDVGDTSKVVHPEFLLPVEPMDCVVEMTKKVMALQADPDRAQELGHEARHTIEKGGWLWRDRAKEYDSFVEECLT